MYRRLVFIFLFLLVLSASTSATEEIVFDNCNADFSEYNWSLSWTHTIGGGQSRILVVGLGAEDSSAGQIEIDTIEYNGVAMDPVAGSSKSVSSGSPTYYMKTDLYYLLENELPASGSYTVTVTYFGEINRICGGSISLENVTQEPAEAGNTNSHSSASSISTNITTVTDGAWIVDVVGNGGAGGANAFTPIAAGMTERYDVTSASSTGAGSTKPVASAGVATVSWSNTVSNRMTHSVAAFAPVNLKKAGAPAPQHLTTDVIPNVQLSWNAGESADSHDVYFGTSLADVTDANNTWPVDTSVYKGNQAVEANSYDPGILDSQQIYYWRIDEVNETDPNVWKGNIWNFTVEEYIAADFTGDGKVNNKDLALISEDWLNSGQNVVADADFDDKVDLKDYVILANDWEPILPEVIPEGDCGVASNYIGDIGIESDPNVILYEDFETRGVDTLVGYWTGIGNVADALLISGEVPPQSQGSRSLQVSAKRGLNTGGQVYKTFPDTYDELYARFYVKFAYDYGFNHHFCKLGTVMGGGAGQLPVYKFWTGLEPTTKLGHYFPPTYYPPPGFWHFYTYWPHMRSWQTPEGVPDGRENPYYGNDFSPKVPTLTPRDEWICVEYMIRVNSDPDDPENSDGVQRFWINGEIIGNWGPGTPIGYWYRDTFRLDPDDPRSGPFEGYRWRDLSWVKLQFFKLENYVSETVFQTSENYKNNNPGFVISDQEATCWFDHVVVSRSYIGPIYQE